MDYAKKDGTFVSEEWMDAISEAAEADELNDSVIAVHEHMEPEEDFTTISIRIPTSCLTAIEKAAERIGESRSDFIRNAVDKALIGA